MNEEYRILQPDEIPENLFKQSGKGPPRGPVGRAIQSMQVGDTIAVPRKSRSNALSTAGRLGMRMATRTFDGKIYLRRLPDDAS